MHSKTIAGVDKMQRLYESYTHNLLSTKRHKSIAVIGSTGLLGPHIVASLLETHKGCRIFCLNRSADGEHRTRLLVQAARGNAYTDLSQLQFLITEITKPDFGLDSVHTELLASEIDEIVFNTWDTNWSKSLEHFEPFLMGIRSSIDFCASSPRQPRLTFISSICAVGDWPIVHPNTPLIPEDVVWDNRSAMAHGYGQSKCIAEQILATASETIGFAVNIVRAGQIGGPADPEHKAFFRRGWLHSIIETSRDIRCFPQHVQELNWIPVDSVASGIANCLMEEPRRGTVRVFNMVHPEPCSWSVLYKTLQSRFGLKAEAVLLPQWLNVVDPAKMKLHGFLKWLGMGREFNQAFENDEALKVLPKSIPKLEENILTRWLGEWNVMSDYPSAKL